MVQAEVAARLEAGRRTSERSQRLVVERDGRSVYATSDIEVRMEHRLEVSLGPSYPVPRILRIRGEEVEVDVWLDRVLASDSPLQLLPAPIRILFRWRMDPRRIWIESRYALRFTGDGEGGDGDTVRRTDLKGSGITFVMFSKKVPEEMADF